MAVTLMNVPSYRGFGIGHTSVRQGFRAAWKSSLEQRWQVSTEVLTDTDKVVPLAKACIDFGYLAEVEEVFEARKLTKNELTKLAKEHPIVPKE